MQEFYNFMRTEIMNEGNEEQNFEFFKSEINIFCF